MKNKKIEGNFYMKMLKHIRFVSYVLILVISGTFIFPLKFFIFSLFLYFLGFSMNSLAVRYNNSKMPVPSKEIKKGRTIKQKRHFYFNSKDKEKIKFYYLTDILRIKRLFFSVGDVLLTVGFILLLINIWTII